MKICDEYAALLDLYLDNECTAQEREQVRQHLESCPACAAYIEDCLSMRSAFASVAGEPVPEEFSMRVMSAIRGKKAPPVHRRIWLRTAVSLAACFLLVILIRTTIVSPNGQRSGDSAGGAESVIVQATETAAAPEESEPESASADDGAALIDDSSKVESADAGGSYAVSAAEDLSGEPAETPKENALTGSSSIQSAPMEETAPVEEPASMALADTASADTESVDTTSAGTASADTPSAGMASANGAEAEKKEYFAELFLTETEAGNLLDTFTPFDSNAEETMYQLTREQFDLLLTQLDNAPDCETRNSGDMALVIVTHP